MSKAILFVCCLLISLSIYPNSICAKKAYIPSSESVCLDTISYETMAEDIVFFLIEKFPPAKTSFNIISSKHSNLNIVLEKALRLKGYAVSFKNHDSINLSYNIEQEDNGDIIAILNIDQNFRYGFIYEKSNENQYVKTGQNIICENISKQSLGLNSDKNKRHTTQIKR